jgi:hypothetical protein
MSNAASDYLENELLDHVLGNASFTSPGTSLYVALFHGTAAGVLTNLEAGTLTDEITLGSYTRTQVAFNAAASGSISNNGAVTFPTATANYDGAVTCIAIMDATSAGNVLFYGELTVAKTVTTGDTFQIADTNLTVSLT